MSAKCKSGVNGSSVGRRRKCRSDLCGNVKWVKGQGEQPVGRAAAPAIEMLVGQGKAICFIKVFEA